MKRGMLRPGFDLGLSAISWRRRGMRPNAMHAIIADKRSDLTALCRHRGGARREVFGSAARGAGFDPATSDIDVLMTFTPAVGNDLAACRDFKDALEKLLGRPVDLVEREAAPAKGSAPTSSPTLCAASPACARQHGETQLEASRRLSLRSRRGQRAVKAFFDTNILVESTLH